jgi:NADH:ubiquinone oxidoreductase subunit F (NADH-binding)
MLAEIETSGLRGAGGAGFPAGRKWRSVREAPGPRFVVGNGEEGEPAAWKDRFLMRYRPWRVVEGIAIAMHVVDADRGYLYVSDQVAAEVLRREVAQAHSVETLNIDVVTVPHTYVAGEETAAIRYLNGGPALPTTKPPRPFESGVHGRPTVVNNVETLAHAAWIAASGADAFRSLGTPGSPGTFLACVSGAVSRPMLNEVPFGTRLDDIVVSAEPSEQLCGVLLGGYFSGFLPADLTHTPASHEALSAHGCGLGNGALVAVGVSSCPVQVVGDLLAFFAHQSAQQCGPCVKGTAAMRDIVLALRRGEASAEDLSRLAHYGHSLQRRGSCQLLDGAALAAIRGLSFFAGRFEEHLVAPCDICRVAPQFDVTGRYAIDDSVLADLSSARVAV